MIILNIENISTFFLPIKIEDPIFSPPPPTGGDGEKIGLKLRFEHPFIVKTRGGGDQIPLTPP